MVTLTSLSALQSEQQQHDEISHRDILRLQLDRRITHMVLHFAKYAGRLLSGELRDDAGLERVLVDSAVICLASANALNIRLAEKIYQCEGELSARGKPLGEWLGTRLAVETGRMAKACESLDHVEDFPYRKTWEASVVAISEAVLVAAKAFGFDLACAIRARWAGIEAKTAPKALPLKKHALSA